MANVETWFNQDMSEPVKVHFLNGNLFCDDNNGNLIGVQTYKDGSAYPLTGSVQGYCVTPTGQAIPVIGTLTGNKAYIILPDSVYAIPGTINIIIKLTSGTDVATICAVIANVIGVGSVAVEPSTATIEAWSAQIAATLATLESSAVLYSASQSLTTEQKAQARNNIGANTSVSLISDDDYKIIIP